MVCPSCEQNRAAAAERIQKLTVGMAVADDFATAALTIQSLRMHHGMTPAQMEIVVIDNKPYSPQGKRLKDFCATVGAQYYPFPEPLGTAPPHNEIFQRATGDVVCAIDSHVLLELGVLQKLMDFARANPFSRDLWHGPLLYDELGDVRNDHLAPKWGTDLMYGVWDVDERSKDPNGPPFEIPMHGMGLCACIRDAWPGVPDGLAGFGGTEGMIHELFRRHGRRILCLPFMRWWHLFRGEWAVNPNPPLTVDKFTNYLIWYRNLALDTTELMELFRPELRPDEFETAIRRSNTVSKQSLDTLYQRALHHGSFSNEHCPTLRRLAMDSDRVIEIVEKQGPSTVAFVAGQPDRVISFVTLPDKIDRLEEFSGPTTLDARSQSDLWLPDRSFLDADVGVADLLFIGVCRTAADLAAVLERCAGWSKRWMVVPGLARFGDVGADNKPGLNKAMGDFLREHTEWTVVEGHAYNNGLHVLSCDPQDKQKVPSWWTSAKNYTKAVIKFKLAGEPLVDEVIYDLRLAACLMCPMRTGDVCSICTCPVEQKALWATEKCPDEPSRWPELTVLPVETPENTPENTQNTVETPEKAEKSLEQVEMDALQASLSLPTTGQHPDVYKRRMCKHVNVTTEVEFRHGEHTTATIQIRCMDCSTVFTFLDRPNDPRPMFQLTPLVP